MGSLGGWCRTRWEGIGLGGRLGRVGLGGREGRLGGRLGRVRWVVRVGVGGWVGMHTVYLS